MFLTYEQMVSATVGAVSVEQNGKWIAFHRFTAGQEQAYLQMRPDRSEKIRATSGVRLAFHTDSHSLSFISKFTKCSSRCYPRFDVYRDGAMIAHFGIDTFEDRILKAEVELGEGDGLVEVYLPWSMGAQIADFALDDGASFVPARRAHTMISYGDSITQGYDSKYPALTYAATLARMMDADSINKGIGGEIFFPEQLDDADKQAPDYITVAYGTNDWSHCTKERVAKGCRDFYEKLSRLYPTSKIFAITPIWRENGNDINRPYGEPVTAVRAMIFEQTADLANVVVISGDNLIPKRREFTTDGLHPNDTGAQIYAQNLFAEIKKYL